MAKTSFGERNLNLRKTYFKKKYAPFFLETLNELSEFRASYFRHEVTEVTLI